MDSLAGYIATAVVSVLATYISQFFVPKIKILFWVSHNFMYSMPENPYLPAPNAAQLALPQVQQTKYHLLTISLTVQNFGRQTAEWVEIVHQTRPDFFQLNPRLDYVESTTPAGEHVVKVKSLAPKEWFEIQLLSYRQQPQLLYIRSAVGVAKSLPWMQVRQYPKWVYQLIRLLVLIGTACCVYWLIRLVEVFIRLAHHP